MLERVLEDREEARFVQELGSLEIVNAQAQIVVRDFGDGLEQRQRHVLTDDSRALEHPLVPGGEPVDARGEEGLHRRRYLDRFGSPADAVRPAVAVERAGLDQVTDALLQEEGIALRALDQLRAEFRRVAAFTQETAQELFGHAARQRLDDDLAVVSLPAPPLLVLRPVCDEEQNARSGQAVHECVEDGLRLGIDPVEVLDHEAQRPALALADEETPDGVERALSALSRVEASPGGVLDGQIEQRQQGGEGAQERGVEVEQRGRHLVADGARVVPLLDIEVAAEQRDHRQVRRARVEGGRERLEDPPLGRQVDDRELPDEPRLADARLADEHHDLAVSAPGLLHGRGEVAQLRIPSDEAAQAPGGRQLEPRADRTRCLELVDFHRGCESLDRDRTEGLHRDVSLDEPQRVLGEEGLAGRRELLHTPREVRRLADGSVVHPQVVAHGSHHDLAGVEAHADLQREPVQLTELLGQQANALLHPERRIAGAHGVVLVGERRAEEGHDAVAHDLVDGALVAVDRLHHPLEDGVEEPPGVFRVAVR